MRAPLQFGFHQLADVIDQPISDALIPRIDTAIQATLQEHSRQLNALLGLFAFFTTKFKFRYSSPAAKKLQELDQNGRARKTMASGFYDVALPIRAAGDAWGVNYVASQKMTVRTINDWMYQTLQADITTVRDWCMLALLANRPYVIVDDEHGKLEILPCANNDAQEYIVKRGAISGATDNHLLTQQNDISDTNNPFPLIRRELLEHPENGDDNSRVIVFVDETRADRVMNLAGFTDAKDQDVDPGIATPQLTGTLDVAVPGTVIGKVNKVWIVSWASMPDDRLIAVPVGGTPALGARQHEQPNLQGFIELPARQDTPYFERQFQRHIGFGAYNRVGWLVMQFGTATYSMPTAYKLPVNDETI